MQLINLLIAIASINYAWCLPCKHALRFCQIFVYLFMKAYLYNLCKEVVSYKQ